MGFAGELEESFTTHTFPTTREELIKDHGDVEIDLPDGTVMFGDVLARLPQSEFERAEDARLLTYSTFGVAAIGRPEYSDRDPPRSGEDPDQVSF